MKRENLAERLAKLKARLHAERLAPARRKRALLAHAAPTRAPKCAKERELWKDLQPQRKREAYEFRDMGRKIARQSREMKRERYVTAILGVKTSWPRIVEHAKYAVCAEASHG